MPSNSFREFSDPDEYQATIRAVAFQAVITAPGEYRSELTRVDLHRLWTQQGKVSLPTITRGVVGGTRSTVLFIAASPRSATFFNGIAMTPKEIVFAPTATEYHRHSAGGDIWCSMSLPLNEFGAAGRIFIGSDLQTAKTSVVRPPATLMSRLLRLHGAAAQLARTTPDIIAHPEVAKAMEQELVRTLVNCLAEGMEVRIDRRHRQQAIAFRRFEDFLEANEDRPLYISELCEAIGVSERVLRLYCQERLGISPHRYLFLRRMHQVRRQLSWASPGTISVTEVATGHGFWELGRFAIAYRQLFGESPSATLRGPPANRAMMRTHALIGSPDSENA